VNWLDVVFVLVIMLSCIAIYLSVFLVLRTQRLTEKHDDPVESIDQETKRGHLFKGPLGHNPKYHDKDK
jgi:uncharacterized membrane protein